MKSAQVKVSYCTCELMCSLVAHELCAVLSIIMHVTINLQAEAGDNHIEVVTFDMMS